MADSVEKSNRLIPAHAGKTMMTASRMPRKTAHPRSRGENISPSASASASCGSSPLTRGKLAWSVYQVLAARLIPAHAGKTLRTSASHAAPKAHPRSRGENVFDVAAEFLEGGSSPLTRGKRRPWRCSGRRLRLIPAHAGKTITRTFSRSPRKAHPRSRGENLVPSVVKAPRYGSSPLTRGKLMPSWCRGWCWRLIPAHAGKTKITACQAVSFPAHPRSRGENGPGIPSISRPPGSSPLTRGKRSPRCRGR